MPISDVLFELADFFLKGVAGFFEIDQAGDIAGWLHGRTRLLKIRTGINRSKAYRPRLRSFPAELATAPGTDLDRGGTLIREIGCQGME